MRRLSLERRRLLCSKRNAVPSVTIALRSKCVSFATSIARPLPLKGCKYGKRTAKVMTRHSRRPTPIPSRTAAGHNVQQGGKSDGHPEKRRKRSAPSSLSVESDKENIDPCVSYPAALEEPRARKKHQIRRLGETREPLKVLWSLERKPSDGSTEASKQHLTAKRRNFALSVLR